jgi:hypothetical protein
VRKVIYPLNQAPEVNRIYRCNNRTLMTLVATEFVPFIVMPENFSILLMLSLRGTIRRFCSLTPYDIEPGMIIFHNGMFRVLSLLCIVQVDTLK